MATELQDFVTNIFSPLVADMRSLKGVNMVNDFIRLDDEANFESIQQKFEWTRTSLVISLSLLIGLATDFIGKFAKNQIQKTLLPYFMTIVRVAFSQSLAGLGFLDSRNPSIYSSDQCSPEFDFNLA